MEASVDCGAVQPSLVVALCYAWESSPGPALSVPPCLPMSASSPSPMAFLSPISGVCFSSQLVLRCLSCSRQPLQDSGQLMGGLSKHSVTLHTQQPLPTVLRVTANPYPVSFLRPQHSAVNTYPAGSCLPSCSAQSPKCSLSRTLPGHNSPHPGRTSPSCF